MPRLSIRPLLLATLVLLLPGLARAQTRPSTEQAQQLLQSRPDLVTQLQQRIATSGMTPDQIRARLRAEGYPDSMLDAYLPGSNAVIAPGTVPSDSVLDALQALGVTDSTDL